MRVLALTLVAGCGFSARAAPFDGSHDVLGDTPADGPGDALVDAPTDAAPDARPPPPIAFRQIKNTEGQNLATAAVALSQPVQAGDLLVVFVGWYKTGTVAAIGDTGTDAFTAAVGPTASGTETQAIYYACGVAAAANETVTVRFASANQDPDVRVADYGGIVASGCLDVAHANTGTGTAIDSGPLATTRGNEVVVAGDFQVNVTSAGDAAFTTRQISGFGDLVEDRIASAAGTFTAHATENMAGAWVMQAAAFRGF